MSTDERGPDSVPLVDVTGQRKMAEESDPYVATAVSLSTPGHDGLAAMARTFVEEFALMGWSREHILRMFRNRHLVGPYVVYRERGEAFVESLVDDVLGPADRSARGAHVIDERADASAADGAPERKQ